jgi:DNA polymerase I-like protein with 3'-5' exonuclease and polymerase domains
MGEDLVLYIDCEWNSQRELLSMQYQYKGAIVVLFELYEMRYTLLDLTYTRLVGHNVTSDLQMLLFNGVITEEMLDIYSEYEMVHDTMQMYNLLTNGMKAFDNKKSYAEVVSKMCNVTLDKAPQRTFLSMSKSDIREQYDAGVVRDYMHDDVKYLPEIYKRLLAGIRQYEMVGKYRCFSIDMQLLPQLVITGTRGMQANVKDWERLIQSWRARLVDEYDEVVSELLRLRLPIEFKSGKKLTFVNLNSTQQVQQLFTLAGVRAPMYKGRVSTKQDLLKKLNVVEPDNRLATFIRLHCKYKVTAKLLNMYGGKLLANVRQTKHLRTSYALNTVTGRLASKGDLFADGTNMQNIPAKTDDGKHLMECFHGDGLLANADMSQAELCIAACLSDDEIVISRLQAGDLHSYLATISWQVISQSDEVINETFNPPWLGSNFRTCHKSINFAIIYGAGAKRISEVLNVNMATAELAYQRIKERLPKLMGFLQTQWAIMQRDGVIVNEITRRRVYEREMTDSYNWIIQNTNAEATKLAWLMIAEHIRRTRNGHKIVNCVHDSIVVDVKDGDDATYVRDCMAKALTFFLGGKMLGRSDLSIHERWHK